jgi:hypothetical protein
MPAPGDCPRIEDWQEMLADAAAPEQWQAYERHLESCPQCQARLDRGVPAEEPLVRLGRQLGDPTQTPADPALELCLRRLRDTREGDETGERPTELYFLGPADRPDLLGTLGEYEVSGVIGQGGMGVVLKAFDTALRRVVAIKVMAAALAGSATARRRFIREAQAAAAVCHDHIVTVHAVREAEGGLPYLVMHYVAGESLQARLDRVGPLEVEAVVQIGLQTALGLAAAHAQGLIHRDVKPANLLLENGLSRVKISDFGLARMANDVRLTQSGMLMGTPEYAAPEQARGEAADHRCDLFSLGCVLYAACAGHSPFRAATPLEALRRVTDQQPRPLRSLNPAVPVWLEALILRLLEKDPAGRFQSAAEVASLLEGYLAHLRQPVAVAAPRLPRSPLVGLVGREAARSSLWKWLLAAGGAVGLIVLLGLIANEKGLIAKEKGRADAEMQAAVDQEVERRLQQTRQARRAAAPKDGLVCLIVNKNSGRCLSVADQWDNPGARVVQGPTPERAAAAERWALIAVGDAFRVRNERSGKVLEIGSANMKEGALAIHWDDLVDRANQHWTFEPVEGGYWLRVGHSKLVLAIGEGAGDEGVPAVQWPSIPDVLDQVWELRLVGP